MKRNVSLILGMVQSIGTIRYGMDYMLGEGTQWWYPLFSLLITIGLFLIYNKYRKLVKNGILFGDNGSNK